MFYVQYVRIVFCNYCVAEGFVLPRIDVCVYSYVLLLEPCQDILHDLSLSLLSYLDIEPVCTWHRAIYYVCVRVCVCGIVYMCLYSICIYYVLSIRSSIQ